MALVSLVRLVESLNHALHIHWFHYALGSTRLVASNSWVVPAKPK